VPRSTIVLAAATALFMPVAAAAQNAVPKIDMEKHCRSRAKASEEMMGDKKAGTQAFDTCLRYEQAAKAAIEEAWTKIPPAYKQKCIQTGIYSPSYAEWISCLEINIDIKALPSKR
jgi:hypothetical protein